MNKISTFGVSALLAVSLSACAQKKPETFTGSAEAGKECVETAAKTYGVSLSYITLEPLTADPSGSYAYAYQGTASQSSGVETKFLCRLNENKAFVDIVTWVPRK